LVSGAQAYRDGEYLYQGFLYGDHGARELPDPADPRQNNQFSEPNGTYTYPSNPVYANNAANLVEFRVKPLPDETAFRITLNTLKDPALVAFTIALGGTSGIDVPWPDGANVVAPAAVFLTVHGSTAQVLNAAGGTVVGPAASVSIDMLRRQFTVLLPHSDFNPTGQVVRMAVGVGLWDAATNRYLLPQATRSSSTPGGAGLAIHPAAFFDVGFRFHEPGPLYGTSSEQDVSDPAWWRDQQQGQAFADGNISSLYAEVDFTKLARHVEDNSGVPRTGSIDRIFASHFEPAQGVDYSASASCYSGDYDCQYQGQLEPYSIYVPTKPPPPSGYGMTLLLHANGLNYNEYFGTRMAAQFADRGIGSIVLTPESRDPGSSYTGLGAVDVFEAWADVARHYHLNPAWTTITGYSLGGLGTYKLAEQFPDLFARAVAIVGSPGGPSEEIPESAELVTLRNIPIQIWDVVPVDELNPYSEPNVVALQQLGYRYDYLAFPGEHFTLALNDQFAPAAAFLGTDLVQPNPAHINYVYAYDTLDGLARPFGDFPQYGLTANHAYWITNLQLRHYSDSCLTSAVPGCGATGSIDAHSEGFGLADPIPSGPQPGAGVLTGGALFPVLPYTELKQTWGPPRPSTRADVIKLNTSNIAALTIDVARAHVNCNVHLEIATDGPVKVTLAGCPRTQPGCPRATGRLNGETLGLVKLGMTRAQARREYRHSSDRGKRYEDFFCLTPNGVRVGYASPTLLKTLRRARRRQLAGRVVWASTSNRYYAVHGVRPGATLAAARKHLKLSGPFHVGLNFWYLAPNGSSTAVLKVRHGRIEEIGIGDRQITQGHRARLIFLKSFA
jgi:pimeloyl-ACP methyl ester carboxylesterase